jgi:hypothetical protein
MVKMPSMLESRKFHSRRDILGPSQVYADSERERNGRSEKHRWIHRECRSDFPLCAGVLWCRHCLR